MFLIKIRKNDRLYRMRLIEASTEKEAIEKVKELNDEFELYVFGEDADKYGRPIYARGEV